MCTTTTFKYDCVKCHRRVDTYTADTNHCVFYRTGAYGLCPGEDLRDKTFVVSEDECEACVDARIKAAEEEESREKAAKTNGGGSK